MINKPYYNLNNNDENNIKQCHETFPVKLSELAAKYDIKIYEAKLPIMASGQIIKDGGIYKITVQKGQSIARQRFTAAHELAHFFLHKDQIGDGIIDNAMYRSSLPSELETQANKLAADILMPMSEIDKKLKEKYNIGELAKYFDVSNQAMQVRLGIPV
jgi:Zn-dependent peptidase ImmA (M78 family)